jgi:hypothetical protein
VTIHIEAVPDPGPLLERIRRQDAAAGLALNPGTPVEAILPYLPLCDLVLVMSVEPGFGGQKFQPVALDKLRCLREKISGLREKISEKTLLSVDGGIGLATIAETAGRADVFVVGSAPTPPIIKMRSARCPRLVQNVADAQPSDRVPVDGIETSMSDVVIRPGCTDFDEQNRIQVRSISP